MTAVKLCILTLIMAPLWATASYGPQAQVFMLKSNSHYCTATLLKNSGMNCQLVTNAHCFENSEDKASLIPVDSSSVSQSIKKYYPTLSSSLDVKVLKIDRSKDLAELNVPENLQQELCLKIDRTDFSDTDSTIGKEVSSSFASMGFHRQKPIVIFSQNLDWDMGTGMEKGLFIMPGQTGLDSLFQLQNLRMYNGMSGGALVDLRDNLHGINVRLIPFQSESYFIPLVEVQKFLKDSKSKKESKEANNTSVQAGDNAGGHGGDNAGGHGGDSINDKVSSPIKSTLEIIREPREGVIVDKKRLLAKGDFQVDGQDDLRNLKDSKDTAIYFESKEYDRTRDDIFSRLEGYFQFDQEHQNAMIDFIFKEGQEWQSLFYGKPGVIFTFKKKSKTKAVIKLSISNISLRDADPKSTQPLGNIEGQILMWTASLNRDTNQVTLESEHAARLICENNNYFKLICVSEDPYRPEELSLSVNNLGIPVGRVRYSKLVNITDKGVTGIYYMHSTLAKKGKP